MDGGAWWAAVHGVAKSQTQLSDFTFHFHALENEMATHSSVLAWRIPGMGEPGGLPSIGSHRVGHDWSDLAAAEAVYENHVEALISHRLQVSPGSFQFSGSWSKNVHFWLFTRWGLCCRSGVHTLRTTEVGNVLSSKAWSFHLLVPVPRVSAATLSPSFREIVPPMYLSR